jgi:hypothetical protein
MKKLSFIGLALAAVLSLAGCSSSSDPSGISLDSGNSPAANNFPLTIDEMPTESAQWGTYCQSILGQGWDCIVDLRVVNESKTPWGSGDYLTANLVADDGSISASSDSPDNTTLTGTFMQTANPGSKWEWSVYFSVGEGQKFTSVQVVNIAGDVVAEIPVCIGSSDALSQGCGK